MVRSSQCVLRTRLAPSLVLLLTPATTVCCTYSRLDSWCILSIFLVAFGGMSSQVPSLRVRINQIDYTVVPPGPLDNSTLHRVPVIRIYGDSSLGVRTCLHIHEVYPYFFVEYLGKMNPDIGAPSRSPTSCSGSSLLAVNRYTAKLKHSLNHAIAISLKRNPESPKSKFVRAVVLVKGVHFYGFHANYAPFLKVHIADPAFVNRAVTIMQSGTVMQTRFRVYESHLSYILQFLCDFGLYGCGWIDLGEVWQRGREEFAEDDVSEAEARQYGFKDSPHFRQTRMPLEVDAAAHQILNRHKLVARNTNHRLTIPAPPLPPEPLVLSVRELWEDERQRRLAKGLSPSPDIPKDPSASSRGPGGDWVAEARWWDEIRKRVERERGRETVPPQMSWEKWVMTTFESVEALWEDEYKTWQPHRSSREEMGPKEDGVQDEPEINPYQPSQGTASTGDGASQLDVHDQEIDVDVDETMLASQDMSRLMEREEAEWQKDTAEHYERHDIDDQYAEEDEEAVEDGPPPDLQSESGDAEERYCQYNLHAIRLSLTQRLFSSAIRFLCLRSPLRHQQSHPIHSRTSGLRSRGSQYIRPDYDSLLTRSLERPRGNGRPRWFRTV